MHFIAPAKVNLSLQVVGKRDDGYHLLSSLVSFTEVGDSIALSPSDNVSIAVTGEFAEDAGEDADNLCVRAAQA